MKVIVFIILLFVLEINAAENVTCRENDPFTDIPETVTQIINYGLDKWICFGDFNGDRANTKLASSLVRIREIFFSAYQTRNTTELDQKIATESLGVIMPTLSQVVIESMADKRNLIYHVVAKLLAKDVLSSKLRLLVTVTHKVLKDLETFAIQGLIQTLWVPINAATKVRALIESITTSNWVMITDKLKIIIDDVFKQFETATVALETQILAIEDTVLNALKELLHA